MAKDLRQMSSAQAADWLISTYPCTSPEYHKAIEAIPHVSWKRADQRRLAEHYLEKMPFADAKVYEAFASFMALDLFVSVIENKLPTEKSDLDLLAYYLFPVLQKSAKSSEDRALVASLMEKMK